MIFMTFLLFFQHFLWILLFFPHFRHFSWLLHIFCNISKNFYGIFHSFCNVQNPKKYIHDFSFGFKRRFFLQPQNWGIPNFWHILIQFLQPSSSTSRSNKRSPTTKPAYVLVTDNYIITRLHTNVHTTLCRHKTS